MAYPNYQIPTKLTFFPSYLQYAYATGQILDVYAQHNILIEDIIYNRSTLNTLKKEDIYPLTNLDPSKTYKFINSTSDIFSFKIPSNWNFDFGMILGHNFNGIAQIHTESYIDAITNVLVPNVITSPILNSVVNNELAPARAPLD